MDLATGVLDFSCLTEGVLREELSLCGLRLFSSFLSILFCWLLVLLDCESPLVLPFSWGERDERPLWLIVFRLLFCPF